VSDEGKTCLALLLGDFEGDCFLFSAFAMGCRLAMADPANRSANKVKTLYTEASPKQSLRFLTANPKNIEITRTLYNHGNG
jgi:hypothetical protein